MAPGSSRLALFAGAKIVGKIGRFGHWLFAVRRIVHGIVHNSNDSALSLIHLINRCAALGSARGS